MCDRHEPFPSVNALSTLPWFELRDGRLGLRDRFLPPAIDVHTHLALAFVRPMAVDLFAAPHPTRHYLPLSNRLDLDVYINQNLSKEDLARLTRDLTLGALTGGGMRGTHTAPNLTREMGEMNIAASVLLPIDFPVLSSNAETYLAVAKRESALLGFGSVHPYARDVPGKLARQRAAGARGIKFHPAVQVVAPDNERALALFHEAGALGLPVLMHCGPVGIESESRRKLCLVPRYERALRENPRTTFVFGHSGALQMEEALTLAKRYENVYLEISCQSLTNVRRIVNEAPSDRILFGSDWPFYHQAIPMAKALLATEGKPAARRQLLHENAERLFGVKVA